MAWKTEIAEIYEALFDIRKKTVRKAGEFGLIIFRNPFAKETIFKRKKGKKESFLTTGVLRPKGNGIKDGNMQRLCVYAVSFWQLLIIKEYTPDNFAFAFLYFL